MELLAVKHGLVLAWNEGHRQVICETDSAEVIHVLHVEGIRRNHSSAQVIMETNSLLKRPWVVELRKIPREANSCTNLLAKVLRSAQGSSIGRMLLLFLDRCSVGT